ncbi:MAG: zinc ribbon domain-containing protein [Acidobacteriota bacterium]
MYCPRCGSPNPDATKFCRQCGLALTQLTGYVASGGTARLSQPQSGLPNLPDLAARATDGMTPKQKLVMTILLIVFSSAIFGVLGGVTGLTGLFGPLAALSGVLTPIGIVWAVIRYKAQKRRTEQAQMMQQPMYPPVAQYSLPQPAQQPIQQTAQQPRQPVYQTPVAPSPPPTNPLKSPGSVIEDETRRLQ